MNDFLMNSSVQIIDKFKLGKKWFWIGIVVATLNVVAGLVYGIAILTEKDRRNEGLIIIAWAIIWALIGFFIIGPFLVKSELFPKIKIIK